MVEMETDTAVVIPYRYSASASAFIEAVHCAQCAVSACERRQHITVARMWYDALSENLRALRQELAETRDWIGKHTGHPLMPRMRAHLASLSDDARVLDRALTDMLMTLAAAGDGATH